MPKAYQDHHMLSAIFILMLSVIKPSVVMLNVVAPFCPNNFPLLYKQ